jgi:DNA-binding MarR family transcriptional regulator
MIEAQRAQNPLFLRDAELERSLQLLTLLQLELEATIAPVLHRLDLEPADAILLARIVQAAEHNVAVSAAELVAYLGWTKQRMSRRLASLLGRGLVDRRRSPVDRRRQDLLPTVIGRQHVAEVEALQKRHLRRVFRRAGPAEVAGFQNVLLVAAQHAARARQATLSGAARPRPANPPSPVDLPGAFEDGHR